VGQPILAAAGFSAGTAQQEKPATLKKPPKKRLRAKLPAPQPMQARVG
jgi:hypothetical protein